MEQPTISQLIRFIREHDTCNAEFNEANGKLVCQSLVYDPASGHCEPTYDIINPDLQSVRNWLGY